MSKKTERINELANAYASAVFDMFMTSLDEDMLNEINEMAKKRERFYSFR
jgi:uncharacterized protein YnzC (UPF0291/DUF896 family)